ncbi:NUDIX domain-containing protein [Streptomyces noursei]|uniref:NUDIX domain-containing protein n=1 Tax=Streptomyces noursei TaxID=1971 RepID=UPI000A667E39|nr:NUDIX domain-containing protein [Streptomyces noursei]
MTLTQRWPSRVLLVDGDDRLLLLCGRDPRTPGARWRFTVGGGVEDGESYPQAAVREETVRPKRMASLLPDALSAVGLDRAPVHSGNFNEDTDPE